MNEQTTKQTAVRYVGKYTRGHLWDIEHERETLATLRRQKPVWKGNLRLSLQEAISILEQQQGVKKTPKDLIAQMSEYQGDIKYIEREPDLYVAPDKARAWYEQQIARIRQQISDSHASEVSQ